jgi:hypothetical protein
MMMRFAGPWFLIVSVAMLWQECGENAAIFCYRMGCKAFAGLRSQGSFVPQAIRVFAQSAVKEHFACSNRFVIFSTRSMMSKG